MTSPAPMSQDSPAQEVPPLVRDGSESEASVISIVPTASLEATTPGEEVPPPTSPWQQQTTEEMGGAGFAVPPNAGGEERHALSVELLPLPAPEGGVGAVEAPPAAQAGPPLPRRSPPTVVGGVGGTTRTNSNSPDLLSPPHQNSPQPIVLLPQATPTPLPEQAPQSQPLLPLQQRSSRSPQEAPQSEPLNQEQRNKVSEGRTVVYNLIPSGKDALWTELVRVGETLVPAVVAIGIGFTQPELIPILPALTAEAEEALIASEEAQSTWATLQPHMFADEENPVPTDLKEAIRMFRDMVSRPTQHPRLSIPEHRLAGHDSLHHRKSVQVAARKWLEGIQNVFPDTFSHIVYTAHHQAVNPRKAILNPSLPHEHHTTHPPPHHPPTDKKKVVTNPESLWVKIGDHSIHSSNLTTELLLDEAPTVSGYGDTTFFSRFGTSLRDANANFQHAAGVGLQVGSTVALSVAGGGYDVPHQLWGTALATAAAPIAIGDPVVRHDLHVHGGPARELGRFTQSSISALLQGGVPSERFVSSAINPNLPITNLAALKNLTSSIEAGWEFYDMTLLYAKLWHYVLLRDFHTSFNAEPAFNALPAGQAPVWINTTDAQLDIFAIPDAIARRDLVLIEGQDIFQNNTDLLITYWVVCDGMRMDGAGNQQTAHQNYIEWPSIGVTVLSRRAAPNAPAAALVPSAALINYICRLATRRAEWGSALRGLYLATELFGTRLIQHGGEWWPLRADLSAWNPTVPGVADYNFMFRLLKIFPNANLEGKDEVEAFISQTPTTRMRAVALYAATLGSAATTLLYDVNITAALLVQWTTGAANTPPVFQQLMNEALNQPEASALPLEPVFNSQARTAFERWMGVKVCQNFYAEDYWNGTFAGNAGGNHAYGNFVQQITPAQFNPLILLEWLRILPFEWGLCTPKPTLNLRREIRLRGPAATQGWYANLGSGVYKDRVLGDFPLKIVVYGVQILNALVQLLRVVNVPPINRQAAFWLPYADTPASAGGGGSSPAGGEGGAGSHDEPIQWGAPAGIPVAQLVYDGDAHLFRPCSIMSYDYENQNVWAPAVLGNALGAGEVQRLTAWTGQSADLVGVVVPMLGVQAAPLKLPGRLNMMRIGGLKARQAGPDSAPPNATITSADANLLGGDGAGGASLSAGNPP